MKNNTLKSMLTSIDVIITRREESQCTVLVTF